MLGDKALHFLLEGEPGPRAGGGVCCINGALLGGALAVLGSEHLGEPVGAKAEGKNVLGFGAQRNAS